MNHPNSNQPKEVLGQSKHRRQRGEENRLRYVDFMRIEDGTNRCELSPFERRVKEAITCPETPLSKLIEKEEAEEKVARTEQFLKRFYEVLGRAGLTPRQKRGFKLFFIKGMSSIEVSRRLKISDSWASELKYSIFTKVKKAILAGIRREEILEYFPDFFEKS